MLFFTPDAEYIFCPIMFTTSIDTFSLPGSSIVNVKINYSGRNRGGDDGAQRERPAGATKGYAC